MSRNDTHLQEVKAWIDKVAPHHAKISCSENPAVTNRTYSEDDLSGCRRCDLLYALSGYKRKTRTRGR